MEREGKVPDKLPLCTLVTVRWYSCYVVTKKLWVWHQKGGVT